MTSGAAAAGRGTPQRAEQAADGSGTSLRTSARHSLQPRAASSQPPCAARSRDHSPKAVSLDLAAPSKRSGGVADSGAAIKRLLEREQTAPCTSGHLRQRHKAAGRPSLAPSLAPGACRGAGIALPWRGSGRLPTSPELCRGRGRPAPPPLHPSAPSSVACQLDLCTPPPTCRLTPTRIPISICSSLAPCGCSCCLPPSARLLPRRGRCLSGQVRTPCRSLACGSKLSMLRGSAF